MGPVGVTDRRGAGRPAGVANTMRWTAAMTIALGLLATMLASAIRAQEPSALAGRVVNGSAGGDATAGLEVTVWMLRDGQVRASRVATTDAQGAFRFHDLPVNAGDSYYLQTVYKGQTYSHGPAPFDAEQGAPDVALAVYETTTDDAGIAIERAHLLLSLDDEGLSVAEVYVILNSGDRTYIGREELDGRRWTSRFALPAGATAPTFDDGALGGRFAATEDGFVDREPQWPGYTSVMFRYRLGCPAGRCRLSRAITQPVRALNVLLPDVGARVEGRGLQFQGRLETRGDSYLNYVLRDLAPGQNLELTVYPAAPGAGGGGGSRGEAAPLPWMIVGALLVVVALGYPIWRQSTAVRGSVEDA